MFKLRRDDDLADLVPAASGVPQLSGDPAFRAAAKEVLGATIDLLADDKSDGNVITRVMDELIAFMQGDASKVLAAIAIRCRARVERQGADVPAELVATRRAFAAVDAWSSLTSSSWSATLLDVPADVETAGTVRFDRALAQGPVQLGRALEAAELGDAMGRVIVRLAEDAIADVDLKPDRREMLGAFVARQRPVPVSAALYFRAHLPEAWREAGAIGSYIKAPVAARLGEDPGGAARVELAGAILRPAEPGLDVQRGRREV